MKSLLSSWQTWALLSALFAALTAIFGKVGIERVAPDFATLIRVVVILAFVAVLVAVTGAAQPLASIPAKTYTFLALSGLATGASWLCYYRALKLGPASMVAPLDKLSVVLVALIGVGLLGEHMNLKNWLGVALITGGAVLVGWKA
ncbi:EamA family transporter [Terricaulis sp.]|uniref:EamA family transporter n=1 Tax=Terricaulis sp. TaxID=2768686 RepID=UPI0037850020